jgi:hypothetical protein
MSKTKSTTFTVSVKATTKKFDLVSDIYQRKLEQLDAGFRRSIHGKDNPTNGERVNRRDFGFYLSSAKGLSRDNESPSLDFPRTCACPKLRKVKKV